MDIEVLEKYKQYLGIIDSHLGKFFEQQKPYIFCKEGCSLCCSKGLYPFSNLEFDFLCYGLEQLPPEIQIVINAKIELIKKNKQESNDEKYFHVCPFLINDRCSVYEYRALVCRSFGLMQFYNDSAGQERYLMPACVDYGLNYSNVYDINEKKFDIEKINSLNYEFEPLSYNISANYLKNNEYTKGLDFGETKALIDWFC